MKTSSVTSLARAIALLRACAAASRPLSFSELARIGQPITPATLSRTLKSLCAHNLLAKLETGTYTVGADLHDLAALVTAATARTKRVRAHLAGLANATGQSSLYVEPHGAPGAMHMRIAERVAVEGGVTHGQVGKTMFVLAQGFGLGLLSQYPKPLCDEIIAEHHRRTGERSGGILEELAVLRSEGVLARAERFASNPGGVTRIVAPVRAAPFPPGSIGVTVFGTTDNVLTPAQITDRKTCVRSTAEELSAELLNACTIEEENQ
ncbi:MAG: hypothetical protein GF331_16930 [Chitinivibrionales bacterium]|nr:hypothetical protein [Chitinivibrionales bacterium]